LAKGRGLGWGVSELPCSACCGDPHPPPLPARARRPGRLGLSRV